MAEEAKAGEAAPAAGQPEQGTAAPVGSSAAPTGPQAGKTDGQPTTGTPAPEVFEIKVGGEVKKVTREQIIALAQQGDDYTRKTQKLSQKEREISDRARQLEARQREIQEKMQRENGGEEPDPMQVLTARQQALEERIADEKLDKTLRELKGKYPDLDEARFTMECFQAKVERFEDMEELAKAHQEARENERNGTFEKIAGDPKHPLSAKWRQMIVDEYLKIKASESKPKGEHGSGGAPAGVEKKSPPKTFEEAGESALAKLNALP